jgi:sensor c-di-GMP phosphodiesterase-like protein
MGMGCKVSSTGSGFFSSVAGAGFVGSSCAMIVGEIAQNNKSPHSRLAKTIETRIVLHPCIDLTDFIVPPEECSRSFP